MNMPMLVHFVYYKTIHIIITYIYTCTCNHHFNFNLLTSKPK